MPLGLTIWQERKLQWLSAAKLKTKNIAWVPSKGGSQSKEDVQVSVVRIAARMKQEKTEAGKQSTLNIPSHFKKFQLARRPYYSAMPFIHMSYSIYPSMTSYPPWSYFEPLIHHNSFNHQRVLPNRYSFD
jgi:hypothetical protein